MELVIRGDYEELCLLRYNALYLTSYPTKYKSYFCNVSETGISLANVVNPFL
jgi:hypothetical protein